MKKISKYQILTVFYGDHYDEYKTGAGYPGNFTEEDFKKILEDYRDGNILQIKTEARTAFINPDKVVKIVVDEYEVEYEVDDPVTDDNNEVIIEE